VLRVVGDGIREASRVNRGADLPDPVVDDVRTAFAGIDFADAATQVIVEIAAGDASRVAGAVEQAVDHDLFGEIGRSGDLGLNRHAFVRGFEPGGAHALVAVDIDGDLLGCGLGATGGSDAETGEAGEGSAGPHTSGLVGFGIEPALAPGVPKPVGLQEALLAFCDAVGRGQASGTRSRVPLRLMSMPARVICPKSLYSMSSGAVPGERDSTRRPVAGS